MLSKSSSSETSQLALRINQFGIFTFRTTEQTTPNTAFFPLIIDLVKEGIELISSNLTSCSFDSPLPSTSKPLAITSLARG